MKLNGKVAVVTGGGTGIGRDAALLLAREGARVIVSARRLEPLQETVQMIEAEGGSALAVTCDVTRYSDIENLYQKAMEWAGRVDILVNNAGASHTKNFLDITMEDFDEVINVDLRSVFAMCKVFVPQMIQNGGGSIINVSSILGVFGGRGMSLYCTAKGGVNNFTRALAAELGPHGIRVNAICPSHIETPMMQPWLDYLRSAGKFEKLEKVFPLRRIGYPQDVSSAILFLASDDSAWITGIAMIIDGGMSCYV